MIIPGRRRSEPNASESRFGLVNLNGGDQPALGGEVCHRRRSNEQEHPPDHPGCLGRARSERSPGNLGDPAWCGRSEQRLRVCAVAPSSRERQNGRERKRASAAPEPSGRLQREWGIHNPRIGRGRESERPIVALKRGNARGAKGPYFSHVAVEERRPA
jgi:hypothetical protein